MGAARFELVQSDAEQPWHARFVAGNGRILWATEQYKSRRAAMNVIESVVEALMAGWIDESYVYDDLHRGPAVVYRLDSWNKTDGLRAEIREIDERVQQ